MPSCLHLRAEAARLCRWLVLLLGLIASAAGMAHARLLVDDLIIDLADPRVSRHDITLGNDGKERLYVEVVVEESLADGADGKRYQGGTPEQLGLLVTPTRLILEPGQRRPVRAVLLARPAVERVYRITLKPVVGDVVPGQPPPAGGYGLNLKLLLGYQALLLARPAAIEARLQGERHGRRLRLENTGNVSLMLEAGRQCATADAAPESCDRLPGRWLRPGAVWDFDLLRDAPATYTVRMPAGKEVRQF